MRMGWLSSLWPGLWPGYPAQTGFQPATPRRDRPGPGAGALVVIVIVIVGALAQAMTAAAQDKITIYFYSAEANINNFKSLKMEFDGYLAQFGEYEFQPFSDRQTFEDYVKGKPRSLVMLSSWHYANIYREYALVPVLVGIRNGQTAQKRILVSAERSATLDQVKTGQIASASSVPHTTNLLAQMFREDEGATAFKILSVPKDLDALMSVGFGMAKSAVITENSFESLRAINPSLHNKLHIIAEGDETLLLVVAAPEDFASDVGDVLEILQHMATDPHGEQRVRMLGLDGWQAVDLSLRSKLEG
jgi:hypothetical protein